MNFFLLPILLATAHLTLATPSNFLILTLPQTQNSTYLTSSNPTLSPYLSTNMFFTPNISLATTFTFASYAPVLQIVQPNSTHISSQGMDGTPGPVYWNPPEAVARWMGAYVEWNATGDGGRELMGKNGRTGEGGLFDCGGTLWLGAEGFVRDGCAGVRLGVMYVD